MSASGLWKLEVDTPMGKQPGTLDLVVDGGTVTGTSTAMGASDPIQNGAADGDHLTFEVRASKPMPMLVRFDVQVDGDTIGGQVALGSFGKASVTGTRA